MTARVRGREAVALMGTLVEVTHWQRRTRSRESGRWERLAYNAPRVGWVVGFRDRALEVAVEWEDGMPIPMPSGRVQHLEVRFWPNQRPVEVAHGDWRPAPEGARPAWDSEYPLDDGTREDMRQQARHQKRVNGRFAK